MAIVHLLGKVSLKRGDNRASECPNWHPPRNGPDTGHPHRSEERGVYFRVLVTLSVVPSTRNGPIDGSVGSPPRGKSQLFGD